MEIYNGKLILKTDDRRDVVLQKINMGMLKEAEKNVLKNRIQTSIDTHQMEERVKRQRFFVAAAAMAVVLVVLAYSGGYLEPSSPIKKYVAATAAVKIQEVDEVQLLLNPNEIIPINNESPVISYLNADEEIQINESIRVQQCSLDNFNTIVVPYGKRTTITFAEGTKVWLNSGSKLTYPITFDGSRREVYLTGEAVFDVTHDDAHPFYVHSETCAIKVLGTVFNVSTYADDKHTSTALASGSVEIHYNDNSFFGTSHLTITPGTLAVYHHETKRMQHQKVDVAKYMSWREGKFIFKKQKLTGILKKLSRYFNIPIVVANDALKAQTFSGHLDVKDTIENVLDVIKVTTELDYSMENGKIIIN